jgi:hypothetical protein
MRLISKNPITKKRAGGVAQGIGPEFQKKIRLYKEKVSTSLFLS